MRNLSIFFDEMLIKHNFSVWNLSRMPKYIGNNHRQKNDIDKKKTKEKSRKIQQETEASASE